MLNNVDNYLAYIHHNYYNIKVNCMTYNKTHKIMDHHSVNTSNFFSQLAMFLPTNSTFGGSSDSKCNSVKQRVHLEANAVRFRQAIYQLCGKTNFIIK